MPGRSSPPSIERILNRVRALCRRQTRQVERCFWIEGVRHFVQAFDAELSFDTVVCSPVLLKSPLAAMLVRRLNAAGVRPVRVSPEQFRAISTADRASGIGAIVRQKWTRIEHADPRRGLCWLVIEELRSAGNLGTILRTAEATGAAGVIFLGPQIDPFDPVAVRASMGGIFPLQMVRATHETLAAWIHKHGVQLVGLQPDAERLWTDLELAGPAALAVGEERQGLPDRLRAICQTMVRLPMVGSADSLNVGVAAGVMMYELVRRARC